MGASGIKLDFLIHTKNVKSQLFSSQAHRFLPKKIIGVRNKDNKLGSSLITWI